MIKYTNVSHEKNSGTQAVKSKIESTIIKEEIKPALKAEKKKKKITPVVLEEEKTEVKEEVDLSEWLKDDIDE